MLHFCEHHLEKLFRLFVISFLQINFSQSDENSHFFLFSVDLFGIKLLSELVSPKPYNFSLELQIIINIAFSFFNIQSTVDQHCNRGLFTILLLSRQNFQKESQNL
jgi:hypothetical protein